MRIDNISSVSPLNNLQNTKRTSQTSNFSAADDEITISEEAKEMSKLYFAQNVAKETPDVRTELVEQIKQKIKDPNYLNQAVISATADSILSAYGF